MGVMIAWMAGVTVGSMAIGVLHGSAAGPVGDVCENAWIAEAVAMIVAGEPVAHRTSNAAAMHLSGRIVARDGRKVDVVWYRSPKRVDDAVSPSVCHGFCCLRM